MFTRARMYNTNKFLQAIAAAFVILLSPLAVHAMGISPVLIEATGLLPNSSLAKTIYLTRSNPAEDEKGVIKVTGPAAQYIRLPNYGTVDMPKGTYNTPYEFFIEPGNLGEGDYVAHIQVAPSVAPQGSSNSGSAILTGAQAEIRFTVTSAAVDNFEIGNPVVNATEEGQILDFTYQLRNIGNVDTSPAKIEMTIHDERDPAFIYKETIDKPRLKLVKAQSSATDDVPTKATLAPGSYLMQLSFYKGDQVIFESRDMRFQVYPRGTLAQKGELVSFAADKAVYDSGEVVDFIGTFKNTGSVGLTATMDISIYQGDKRLEVLGTNDFFVATGQSLDFEKTYRPDSEGAYSAVGVVRFGPQKTAEITSKFTVQGKLATWIILAVLSVIVIILMILFLWIRRRVQKSRSNVPPAEPPAPSEDNSAAPTEPSDLSSNFLSEADSIPPPDEQQKPPEPPSA